MGKKMITAVFASRSKAEEAVSQLSQLGFADVYMKTSRQLPDFSSSGVGSLAFIFGGDNELEFTTVSGTIADADTDAACRIIVRFGGRQ